MCAKSRQPCPTLCDPMDCSPPSASVCGILQARILSGLPCPPSGIFLTQGLNPSLWRLLHWQGGFFTTTATWEALYTHCYVQNGLPRQLIGKESSCQCRRQVQFLGGKDPLEKEMQPSVVSLPGKSHGQRSITGYSPWAHKSVRNNSAGKQHL